MILLFAGAGGIASAAFAVVFLWVPEELAQRVLPHLVSFATGALLGAALLALLPEALERAGTGGAGRIGVVMLLGLGTFFVIEKLVLWWHAHDHGTAADESNRRERATGVLVLIGDSIHNALDGVLIAAAFIGSVPLGLVTTLAVAAHEIPHRVGDFVILLQAGFSRARAFLLNLATGMASLLGALLAYLALHRAFGVLPDALAFAAAGFLYIAVAGLIPTLQRRSDLGTSAAQLILMAAGVAIVAAAEALSHQ
jgi:zinc and cadmium transporter